MKAVLARYGLSRREVAKALDVSAETVRLWCLDETGPARSKPPGVRPTQRPSAQNAIAMEEKLGIPRWETRPDLWRPPAGTAATPDEDPQGGSESQSLAAA